MLVISVPVVLLSPMFAEILGYELPDVPGIEWVSPILGTVLYFWGGRPFLSGAITELKARKPAMMMLIGWRSLLDLSPAHVLFSAAE
jgi:Cu2+-exporting ATPase